MDRQALIDSLRASEGLRLMAYDDATGKPLSTGSVIEGHPTIGIGRCLDTNGITEAEALYLLNNDIDRTAAVLALKLPWVSRMNGVREQIVMEMAFNMGIWHLLGFKEMLGYMQEGRFNMASVAMQDSLWAKQVGSRATRLANMMRTGIGEVV